MNKRHSLILIGLFLILQGFTSPSASYRDTESFKDSRKNQQTVKSIPSAKNHHEKGLECLKFENGQKAFYHFDKAYSLDPNNKAAYEYCQQIRKIHNQQRDEIKALTAKKQSLNHLATSESIEVIKPAPGVTISLYSNELLVNNPRLAYLANVDPDHQKQVFEFSGFPQNEELIIFKNNGEFLPEFNEEYRITILNDTHWLHYGLDGESFMFVSCKGFIPGYKHNYKITNESGTFKREFSFIHLPINVLSKNKEFSLTAELTSIHPVGVYAFRFQGLQNGEELKIKSISGLEIETHTHVYREKDLLTFSFDTVDQKGGFGKLTITRKSGDQIQVELPWGEAFIDYIYGKKTFNSFQTN